MIKIRLARGGSKNKPFYRIVAIESTRKRGGKALDTIGIWNPMNKNLKIDKKKLEQWIKKGAKKTLSVDKLIKDLK